jgi:predicted nucleotidyltransferase
MINLTEILSKIKERKDIFQKYDILSMAVFGSVSRGDNTPESDIDILVEFKKPIGIKFIDLAYELETILKNKIDLVSRKAVKPKYFEQIKNELYFV